MFNWVYTSIFLVACFTTLSGQEQFPQKYFVGSYYTFIGDDVVPEGSFDTVNYKHQYLNLNFRYALNRVWRVGAEYILTFTSTEEVADPFSTVGVTLDYDILRAQKSKLHLRVGLSFSNLSFAGEGYPQRRFVFNRIIGGSYEYRISNTFWVYGGFYHHLPFDQIEEKYAMIQPFLGVCVGW